MAFGGGGELRRASLVPGLECVHEGLIGRHFVRVLRIQRVEGVVAGTPRLFEHGCCAREAKYRKPSMPAAISLGDSESLTAKYIPPLMTSL
jgi:hypothetical protein